jgi:hypothetical protein
MSDLNFEEIPGVSNLKISKGFTTPNGKTFAVVMTDTQMMLTSQTDPPHTIIVTGDLPTGFDIGSVLGGVGDALGDALAGLLKFITCKPRTVTHLETHKDGTCSYTQTTDCAPS